MSFPGHSGFGNNPATPDGQMSKTSPFSYSASRHTPNTHQTTPTKQSVNMSLLGSTTPSDNLSTYSPQAHSSIQTPTHEASEAGEPWSSAVGRATTSGKSGRIIDRLMGDNVKLKKELIFANAKMEEEIMKCDAARTALDELRGSNEHFSSMYEVQTDSITRRDKKIEELKAELEMEKSRRVKAEADMMFLAKDKNEIVQKCKRETTAARERSESAMNQYHVLSRSWKGLDEGYRRTTQKLKADFDIVQSQRMKDQQRLAQLEVVSSQLRQQMENSIKAKDKMAKEFEEYKTIKDKSLKDMIERATSNESNSDRTLKEAQEVLGKMKWVINVNRDVNHAE
ncbi:hypothetical protein MMC14_006984 [Varicellaria rhodocarpa]|nr:hypothetical protein [Varicellaria rhodocarpa]